MVIGVAVATVKVGGPKFGCLRSRICIALHDFDVDWIDKSFCRLNRLKLCFAVFGSILISTYLLNFFLRENNTIINKNQKMRFNNFVSTLAVACLAFNAEAVRIEVDTGMFDDVGLDFSGHKINYKKSSTSNL